MALFGHLDTSAQAAGEDDFHGSGVSQLEEDAVIDDYSVNHDDAVLRGRDGGTCEMKQNRTGARYG
ncbi:hypothetical protein L916_01841 [Phytophthora nicotianae]|uniref:Uncharacterized protein n=1 Tax=Phytophthora nicotianae TaxID=4792 RepID=W2JQ66_PHYNI|nr:hypothetical protein L916_01841 [Phytophthora nicotianae]